MFKRILGAAVALCMCVLTFAASPAEARYGWHHYGGWHGGYYGGWGRPHYGYGSGFAMGAGLGFLGGQLLNRPRYVYPAGPVYPYGSPYGSPYGLNVYTQAYPW